MLGDNSTASLPYISDFPSLPLSSTPIHPNLSPHSSLPLHHHSHHPLPRLPIPHHRHPHPTPQHPLPNHQRQRKQHVLHRSVHPQASQFPRKHIPNPRFQRGPSPLRCLHSHHPRAPSPARHRNCDFCLSRQDIPRSNFTASIQHFHVSENRAYGPRTRL